MIVKLFHQYSEFVVQRLPSFIFLFLISLISLSCNQPFQPEVQYTPELNVYSVLFANSQAVYVRVTPVVQSPSDVAQLVHGAVVKLVGTGPSNTALQSVTLADTTVLVDGTTASFYYAPAHIIPGGVYTVSVIQDGYPPAYASASVPFGYATIPDQNAYSVLQNPKNVQTDINLTVNLSGLATAEFVQMIVECRGLDSTGNFNVASFNVIPVDSLNPFTETDGITTLSMSVDITQYNNAFKLAHQYATSLRHSHLYVDIIVTQVDDNLYRFFITSTRTASPLLMRTDKIVFSNIFNNTGTGIVAGASIDTTRIFLF